MNEYKIEVANEAESKEVQELFFELGYAWAYEGSSVHSVDNPYIFAYADRVIACACKAEKSLFEKHPKQQITLPELRILALLKRNDVNDATHVDEDGEKWFKSGDDYYISGLSNEWIKSDKETAEYHNVKPIQKKEKDMSNLISGKEAKLAWANEQEVEVKHKFNNEWGLVDEHYSLGLFGNEDLEFRLKPQTITVTLELPKPFKPVVGDKCWFVSPYCSKGYSGITFVNNSSDATLIQFGAYRTEEEVKQAVEAKRAAALEALNA